MIDAHNHLADPRFSDPAEILRTAHLAGVTGALVNATCEDDWENVAELARKFPAEIFPAFGIHPWRAHTTRTGWETRLCRLLEEFPRATIGEIGLDGWVSDPPLAVQFPIFTAQIALAREIGRACTIHCLKAWEPLFNAFATAPPPEKFLMHSFGGSLEIARRLIPMGAYFSFSGYFLHARKHKTAEVFRLLPHDRILVETDAPDMLPPTEAITCPLPDNLNHPANLSAISARLAAALGIIPARLAALHAQNLARFLAPAVAADGA